MTSTTDTLPRSQAAAPRSAARSSVKPAGFWLSNLMILSVLIMAEVAGDAIRPMRLEGPSPGDLILLALGGAALIALVALNARWLWVTLGYLRYALALMFLWTFTSALGTLVVQRFPNQTDEGYAKTYIAATGDFLYNMKYFFSGVVVQPEADVEAWLADTERHFGRAEAAETRKAWTKSEEQRIRGLEIERYTADHRPELEASLAFVSALRLPEAFQISVWFKALLGLLCLSLVIVVIQRWRGEWRQVGWAMAHLGMVIFIVGATVRTTRKVDGFLPMKAGETSSAYFRKVGEYHDPRDPYLSVSGGQRNVYTPLDFDFTLHRFKTEYPKQLFVTFPDDGVQRSFLPTRNWKGNFANGGVNVSVVSSRESVSVGLEHIDLPTGRPAPAVLLQYTASWLDRSEALGLPDNVHGGAVVIPPDNSHHLEYRRAADEAEREQLLTRLGRLGRLWTLQGDLLGDVEPGRSWSDLPGAPGFTLRATAVVPDWARRDEALAAEADPEDPALALVIERDGVALGSAWIHGDRAQLPEGLTLPVDLRFEYDLFASPAPVRYRIVNTAGQPPELAVFRGDSAVERRRLVEGELLALGDGGDHVSYQRAFERHARQWVTAPADTTGMTPEDVYYAELPQEVVLRLTGTAVEPRAAGIAASLGRGETPPADSGIVSGADFERGLGHYTATPDGRGLLVRLVSDHAALAHFPDARLTEALRQLGGGFDLRLDLLTNDRAQPLRFTSDVTLSRGGVPLKRALVEPNKPLYLAGFQFSQADFRKDDPTYSGFGVVRDPSVRSVYFGMILLTLGVTLLFYVHPVVAARKRRSLAVPGPTSGSAAP